MGFNSGFKGLKPFRSFETYVPTYRITQCHIPEQFKLQQHGSNNFKNSHKTFSAFAAKSDARPA